MDKLGNLYWLTQDYNNTCPLGLELELIELTLIEQAIQDGVDPFKEDTE